MPHLDQSRSQFNCFTLSILVFNHSAQDLNRSKWGISIHLAHAWFWHAKYFCRL